MPSKMTKKIKAWAVVNKIKNHEGRNAAGSIEVYDNIGSAKMFREFTCERIIPVIISFKVAKKNKKK